jgi:hypothetical protein
VRRTEHRPDRVRKRIGGQRLPGNGCSFEQRQPDERPLEPRSIRLDDPITIKSEPDQRKLRTASRIAEKLNHSLRLAAGVEAQILP